MAGTSAIYRAYLSAAGAYRSAVSVSRKVALRVNAVAATARPTTRAYSSRDIAAVAATTAGYVVTLAKGVTPPLTGAAFTVAARPGTPTGLIAVVTARTRLTGGTWRLTAVRTGLAAAFTDLTISSRLVPAIDTNAAAARVASAQAMPLGVPDVSCEIGSARPTITPKIDVSGLVFDTVVDVRSRRLVLAVSGPVSVSMIASSEGKLSCSVRWPVVRRQVASIYGVPVILTVGPQITLGLSQAVSATLTSAGRIATIISVNGSVVTTSTSAAMAVNNPNLGVDPDITASLSGGVSAGLSIAELVGVSAEVGYKVSASQQAGLNPDPCATVAGAITANLKTGGRAFGIVGWSFELLTRDFLTRELWSSCTPEYGILSGPAGFYSRVLVNCPGPPPAGQGVWVRDVSAVRTTGWITQTGVWKGLQFTPWTELSDPIGSTSHQIQCAFGPPEGPYTVTKTYPAYTMTVTSGPRTVSVTPGAWSPGQLVTVSSNQPCPIPGAIAAVVIDVNNGPYSQATASTPLRGDGSWSIQMNVPDAPPGASYAVTSGCQSDTLGGLAYQYVYPPRA